MRKRASRASENIRAGHPGEWVSGFDLKLTISIDSVAKHGRRGSSAAKQAGPTYEASTVRWS
ncbi:MAG: hypothetical protein NVSMB1_19050 [Polyangiales bacterium]